MRRLWVWLVAAGMVVALVGVMVPVVLAMRAARSGGASSGPSGHVPVASAPPSGASGSACSSWYIAPSPSPGKFQNGLASVATVSASDAWAVGITGDTNIIHTLAEHWNGAAWSVVATPDVGSSGSFLQSVAAAASNDVWAVGYSISTAASANQTLIEHWNGSAWSVVPSPNAGGTGVNNQLNGIAALSSSAAWAVGASGSSALIEQWNGSTWSVVTPPSVSASTSSLAAVAALSPDDVVVVGTQQLDTGVSQTLIEQWNGSVWSVVSSPNAGISTNILTSVSALSASDIWVGGYYNAGGSATSPVYQALAEHWNGTAWSVVATPSLSNDTNIFLGIAAVSANNVWAVGLLQSSQDHTLAEHWNGSTWQLVPTPNSVGD